MRQCSSINKHHLQSHASHANAEKFSAPIWWLIRATVSASRNGPLRKCIYRDDIWLYPGGFSSFLTQNALLLLLVGAGLLYCLNQESGTRIIFRRAENCTLPFPQHSRNDSCLSVCSIVQTTFRFTRHEPYCFDGWVGMEAWTRQERMRCWSGKLRNSTSYIFNSSEVLCFYDLRLNYTEKHLFLLQQNFLLHTFKTVFTH